MNLGKNNGSESAEQDGQDLTTQVLKWARDRTEALEGGSTVGATKSSQEKEAKLDVQTERKANLDTGIVVVILHEGADDRGDAHLFGDANAAGPFVESLVADGVQEQRIVAFSCSQLAMNVTYRPVVRLQADAAPEEVAS